MKNIVASVIIPAYNAESTLGVVLNALEDQTFNKEEFEVIVVDDGSINSQLLNAQLENWSYDLYIIRQSNKGRAAARNTGCKFASGRYFIFCDADRIPIPTLISDFVLSMNESDNVVSIGNPLDYFGGRKIRHADGTFDWGKLHKFSRESNYYSNICNLYNNMGATNSGICWASFLVGNSCVSKKEFYSVGGFDEKFTDWGFEHYDLGFRLFLKGCQFTCLRHNYSFHLPHKRESGFYLEKLKKSEKLLSENHKNFDFKSFYDYIEGSKSLQEFEVEFTGSLSDSLTKKEPLYIKIINF